MIQNITQASASASVFEVRETCTALGVSCSGFYAHRHKAGRVRRCQDGVLAEALQSAFDQSLGTYGSPRLVRALRHGGLHTSKTRVRRLMQSHGLCPRQKRRIRMKTTRSNPHWPVAPHLLLESPPAAQPGQRFYSDITYIPTQEGWLFTAATLDGYSRKCARAPFGWGVPPTTWKRLWCCARHSALLPMPMLMPMPMPRFITRIVAVGCPLGHASEMFRDFLGDNEVIQSMSRKANCYDNALMESFWATLKTECFDNFRHGIPATRGEAKQLLFGYIEVFYNRKRLHSSLGYCSPVEFEEIYKRHNLKKEDNLSLSVSA